MNDYESDEDCPQQQILGIDVRNTSYSSLCNEILGWCETETRGYCCFTNPHSLVMCQSDETFREATQAASIVLPDGAGVILGSRLLGYKQLERVTGPTTMLKLIETGLGQQLGHFFYGSSDETLEKLCDNLRQRYPGINICGSISPPFRELEQHELNDHIASINSSGAEVVWVGLGAPKQEIWLHQHFDRLNASVGMAVGAAFDYHAGTVKWAPPFVRKLGIEWAYRFVQQPRRLLRRNLNSFVFVRLILKSKLGRRQTLHV